MRENNVRKTLHEKEKWDAEQNILGVLILEIEQILGITNLSAYQAIKSFQKGI